MKLNFKEKEVTESSEDITIVIPNPLEFIYVVSSKKKMGKWVKVRTKKYLTANLWYSSTGSFTDIQMRTDVKKGTMWFLHSYVKQIPKLTKFPIRITYIYYSNLRKVDLQNKLYFWAKLFEDYLVSRKVIPDDSIYYIQSEHYEFIESKDYKLVIKIQCI